MPGSVTVAAPSGVFPQALCTAFTEDRSYLQLQSMYHDGSIQRGQLVATSRRSFRLSQRLSFPAYILLNGVWVSNGPTIPFFYYVPFDQIHGQPTGSNYDPTGNSVTGRVTVRFANQAWTVTSEMARASVADVQLVEVA